MTAATRDIKNSSIPVLVFVVAGIMATGWMVSHTKPEEATTPEQNASTHTETYIELSAAEVAQGETLVVELFGDVTSLQLESERVPFSSAGDRTIAVIGFDTRAPIGTRALTYQSEAQRPKTLSFEVVAKTYPITRVVVPPALASQGVTSGDLAESLAQSDNVTLDDILVVETPHYHFTEPFVQPTDEWIDVGGFGNVREDQYGSIRHLGTDLDGKTGDPVYAANSGVVVYVGELQNLGTSIVIDHGLGIFSLYLHLSSTRVETGTAVARGARIGSVGNTGAYSLSPHLHFSVKVRQTSVDPRTFIDTIAPFTLSPNPER